MTLKEKMADWLTGGLIRALHAQVDEISADVDEAFISRNRLRAECDRLREGHRRIIAMETPGANATVKRMAAVSKECLG